RAIGDDDLGTLAGEEIGGGAADAGAGPGHDGHLPRDPIPAWSIADGSGLAHFTSSEWKSLAQTETPEQPRGPSGIRANWRSKLAGDRLAAIALPEEPPAAGSLAASAFPALVGRARSMDQE